MIKRRWLVLAALAVMVLVLASCVTVPDTWIGQTRDQVTATYGSPNGRSPDGHGGEVWVYLETQWIKTLVMTNHGPSDEMTQYLMVRQFWLDKNGVVTAHRDSRQ